MRINPKKQAELTLLRYFAPAGISGITITHEDIERYFEWSEQGKHKDKICLSGFTDGFNLLRVCKERRGLYMRMWEEGVLEGTVPYFTLLGGFEGERKWYNPLRYLRGRFYNVMVPRPVVDFMKGEMFHGIDADLIEQVYVSMYPKQKMAYHEDG